MIQVNLVPATTLPLFFGFELELDKGGNFEMSTLPSYPFLVYSLAPSSFLCRWVFICRRENPANENFDLICRLVHCRFRHSQNWTFAFQTDEKTR